MARKIHHDFRKGQRIRITFKTNEVLIGKFKENCSTGIYLEGSGWIPYKKIRAIVINRERGY